MQCGMHVEVVWSGKGTSSWWRKKNTNKLRKKKKRCDDEEELQLLKQIESLFLLKELPSSPECWPCGAEKQPSALERWGPTTSSLELPLQYREIGVCARVCVSLCAQVREEVEWHRQRENKDVEWVARVMWDMPPCVVLTDWVIAGNSKGRKRDAFLILLFRYGGTASQAGYLA